MVSWRENRFDSSFLCPEQFIPVVISKLFLNKRIVRVCWLLIPMTACFGLSIVFELLVSPTTQCVLKLLNIYFMNFPKSSDGIFNGIF